MDIPLSAVGILRVAIGIVYQVSRKSWNEPIPDDGLSQASQDVYGYALRPQRPTEELYNSQIATGLYNFIGRMSRLGFFCYSSTNLYINNSRTGFITFKPLRDPDAGSGGHPNLNLSLCFDTNATAATAATAQKKRLTNLTEGSWQVWDPTDPDFMITYTQDPLHSKPITDIELLTTAVDGLASAAQFDDNDPCDGIAAASASGDLFISLESEGWRLNYKSVKQTFNLLPLDMYDNGRMVDHVSFVVEYRNATIGRGYVLPSDNGDGRGGTADAR